jgi:hypothetical protein
MLRLTAKFTVKLKADEGVSDLLARVRVTCPVLADGQIGDEIPLQVIPSETEGTDVDPVGWINFQVTTDGVSFDCRSDPYDALWTVKFIPEVEPVEIK